MPQKKNPKKLTAKEAFLKLASYCAYQERCEFEVREKLADLGMSALETEQVMAELRAENFLNEARFAELFAGGKFRVKGWGKLKITQALVQKRVPKTLIYQATDAIDEDDYLETLRNTLEKKQVSLKLSDSFKMKQKLFAFASSRGFEPDLIWQTIKEMEI